MSVVDPESLERLQSRDPEALTRAVEDHTESLMGVAWSLGWRDTEAEDLVQETYVTFLQAVPRFEGRSTVKTFLIGILYKKALEKRRSFSRELSTDPIDEVFEKRFGFIGLWRTLPCGPEDQADAKEVSNIVEDCMEGLPLPQRLAFHMKEVNGESTESLCNVLDVTPTHLGVLLFRARNKLRECVQKKWGTRE